MYALNIADDGRILSATYPQFAPANGVSVSSLPDGNIYDYRYVNGEYIYDPLPQPEEPSSTPSGNDSAIWDELDAAYQEGVDSV